MLIPEFPLRVEFSKYKLPYRLQNDSAASGVGNSRINIQSVRILCNLRVAPLGQLPRCHECLIDTGAPISVIPQKVWTEWPAGFIEWFEPENENAKRALSVQQGVNGKPVSALLGRIKISLWTDARDRPQERIATEPFEIIAKFVQEESTFNRAVLGFGGNAMERWQGLDIDFRKPRWTARLV